MTEHDFYTRKPFKMPRRADGSTREIAPPRMEGIDPELVALYVAEHRVSERIVAGFLAFGLEPPTREQIEAQGITTRQSKILDATAPDNQLGDDDA